MPDIVAMLTHERDKLNRAIEALGDNVAHAIINMTKAGKPDKRQGKHTVSAKARARMAAAQKARWAKVKASAVAAAKQSAPAKKVTMSPEAKAKIAAAQKARWANIKKDE